jgi:hypothetical protein
MANLTTTALNTAWQAIIDALTHISLHSADGGTTGANETTAGRVAVTEADFTVSAGGVTLNAGKAFTGGAASGAVTHIGLWVGSTYYGTEKITTGDLVFNAAGQYTLDAVTLTGTSGSSA